MRCKCKKRLEQNICEENGITKSYNNCLLM